jgi:hypothetical protein
VTGVASEVVGESQGVHCIDDCAFVEELLPH